MQADAHPARTQRLDIELQPESVFGNGKSRVIHGLDDADIVLARPFYLHRGSPSNAPMKVGTV